MHLSAFSYYDGKRSVSFFSTSGPQGATSAERAVSVGRARHLDQDSAASTAQTARCPGITDPNSCGILDGSKSHTGGVYVSEG